MKRIFLILSVCLTFPVAFFAQSNDSIASVDSFQKFHRESEQILFADSIRKADLALQISLLQNYEVREKQRLQAELQRIELEDSMRKAAMKRELDRIHKSAKGYPVTLFSDTLFYVYIKIASIKAPERAQNISKRIRKFYDDEFAKPDSLRAEQSDRNIDLVYGEQIIMTITELDALVNNTTLTDLANHYLDLIRDSVKEARIDRGIVKTLIRLLLVLLVVTGIFLLIKLISRGHKTIENYILLHQEKWLKNLSYKDYTFLSAEQELRIVFSLIKLFKWFLIILFVYLLLPLVFSIFPFTRSWAVELFRFVWTPFRSIGFAVWDYLPNLFTIAVIVVVIKFLIRSVRYFFSEIEAGKLNISGFHTDWAMPTFSIVKMLLYAFMFVLIFPYLPGSDSEVFKGVSVFIGILFSLGSSSAISNMIAGLVITYMRPFKIGDRIKINDNTGIVVEKTLLVTRLRTIKNEEITIPNSAVLSGNTTNYSALSQAEGLIVHTTVTIGYDVPWVAMHEALIEAALRTEHIIPVPVPFVLQTSLDDFYVSYQLNAYTREAAKAVEINSEMHKNILNVCAERGIEIMSPHYRAERDGSETTIPKL